MTIESVWDYPRPPKIEPTAKHIEIVFNGILIADTRRAVRVLETSHAPVYYIPPDDIRMEYLTPTPQTSVCEWKGQAAYYTVHVDDNVAINAAWTYLRPLPDFEAIAGYVAFYAEPMDACMVDAEVVRPQPGKFYGGWITGEIRGPFKGEPGSEGW